MTLPLKDDPAARLFRTARSQQGYFTSRQAIEAGFPRRVHATQATRGTWSRALEGVYRLSDYPVSANEYLMAWYLWTDRKGAYSHETAAYILDLGDVLPSRLELTVPPGFRKTGPPGLRLFRARLNPKDIRSVRGLQVTVPLRIVLDLLGSDIDLSWVATVVEDALNKRFVTRRSVEALLPRLDVRHRRDAESLLKEIRSAPRTYKRRGRPEPIWISSEPAFRRKEPNGSS